MGLLSGVVAAALKSAFELSRELSEFPEAELIVEEVPIRILCPRCQVNRPITSLQEFACAECGAPTAEVTQGREMEVVALEIE